MRRIAPQPFACAARGTYCLIALFVTIMLTSDPWVRWLTRQAPAKTPVAVISVRSHATRGAAPHDSFGVDTAVWWPILVCLVHR